MSKPSGRRVRYLGAQKNPSATTVLGLTQGDNPFQVFQQYGGFPCWNGGISAHGSVSKQFDWTRPRDVVEIIAHVDADDYDMVAIVRMKDGRYVSWSTFVDVTGSGFFEDAYGGDAEVHVSKDFDLINRFGLTDEQRNTLGIPQPKGSVK